MQFVILLPEGAPAQPAPPEISDEDRARARRVLDQIDPEVDRSFVAFALDNLGCDFDDCERDADLIVVAAHPSVRKIRIVACCADHAECLRVTIEQRRPGRDQRRRGRPHVRRARARARRLIGWTDPSGGRTTVGCRPGSATAPVATAARLASVCASAGARSVGTHARTGARGTCITSSPRAASQPASTLAPTPLRRARRCSPCHVASSGDVSVAGRSRKIDRAAI